MFKVTNIETTPNPDALKFMLDKPILAAGVRHFDDAKEGATDPLAVELFKLKGVLSVFYTGTFVTVTKEPGGDWNKMGPSVMGTIQACEGVPADGVEAAASNGSAANGNGKNGAAANGGELLERINEVLENNIRPALAGDGGGLDVVSLDGYTLTIHYQGACGSCPSSTAGTMGAVQNLLQRMVDPKIKVVSDQGMMGHY